MSSLLLTNYAELMLHHVATARHVACQDSSEPVARGATSHSTGTREIRQAGQRRGAVGARGAPLHGLAGTVDDCKIRPERIGATCHHVLCWPRIREAYWWGMPCRGDAGRGAR